MAEDLLQLCSQCNKNVKKVPIEELYESWSSTQIRVVKFKHTWTISNFSLCCQKKLESPRFSDGTYSENLEWFLSLYPNEKTETGEEIIDCKPLYLNLIKGKRDKKTVKAQCGIVNAEGESVTIADSIYLVFESEDNSDTFANQQCLLDDISEYAFEDELTIFCEMIVEVASKHFSGTLATPHHDLSLDFTFLLANKYLSDVIISADGLEFPAHKVILSAHSSVFRAMFQHDMEENRNNRLQITDIGKEHLGEILRYMYTGKINELEEMAPRLLDIAEKYELNDLKTTCEKALMKILSLENVVELFILSDRYSALELKNQVRKFIAAHALVLGNTLEFRSIFRTHPDLAVEAFCTLSGSSCSS